MSGLDYIPQSKCCKQCGTAKPATTEYFSKCARGILGLHSWCKDCCARKRREDRAKKPEHYAEIERRRYERHTEARKLDNRARWAQRKDKYLPVMRDRMNKNRARYNFARNARRAADPLSVRKRAFVWYGRNKGKLNEMRRIKWKAAPIHLRLRVGIGAAISHSLRGSGKAGKGWQAIVGYTTKELMAHLERQFLSGMAWDNYGRDWHVDHIIPVSSFKYKSSDDAEFKACWALTNLRPFWANDNLRKGARVLHLL